MHAATEAVGMMASLTSFLLWLPQGLRVWRSRRSPGDLAGIAVSTQVISLAGNVLWLAYAVLIGSFWLGAPAVVNLPIAVMTITVLTRARRPAVAQASGQAETSGQLGTDGRAGPDGPAPALPDDVALAA